MEDQSTKHATLGMGLILSHLQRVESEALAFFETTKTVPGVDETCCNIAQSYIRKAFKWGQQALTRKESSSPATETDDRP